VTTLAGTGAAAFGDGDAEVAAFNQPAGIAITPHGDVVIADTVNNLIRLLSST
jgi:hypothetical protein